MMRITCPICGRRFSVRGRKPIKNEDINDFIRLMRVVMKKFFLNNYRYYKVTAQRY